MPEQAAQANPRAQSRTEVFCSPARRVCPRGYAPITVRPFSFGGQFTTMGDPALFRFRNNRDFEFYDNLSYHKGRHTLKLRAYFMHL